MPPMTFFQAVHDIAVPPSKFAAGQFDLQEVAALRCPETVAKLRHRWDQVYAVQSLSSSILRDGTIEWLDALIELWASA